MQDVKEIFALLKRYDTPTICNAIEIVKGGRTNAGFTTKPVFCTEPELPPMVGYAKTASLSGWEPPSQSPEEVLQIRLDYHNYIAAEPHPSVLVMQDLDYPNPIACFFGEINMAVHKNFGLDGILTSGLVRDLEAMDKGMPIVAAGVGVSHAFVTVKSIGEEVDILGMKVKPDQVVHADAHGGVVIEDENMLRELPRAIQHVIDKEKIVLDVARADNFTAEKLNQAWLKFAQADKNYKK